MQITYRKKFLKELVDIPLKHQRKIERFAFEQFPKSKTIFSMRKIERISSLVE